MDDIKGAVCSVTTLEHARGIHDRIRSYTSCHHLDIKVLILRRPIRIGSLTSNTKGI